MDNSTPANRRRRASSQNDEIIVLDDAESTTLKKVKKEANAPKRLKKDSIDVSPQEVSDRQPTMRIVKREEPEPFPPLPVRPSPSPSTASAEILELRQHLLMARQESVNNQQQLINASHQLIGTEMEMARKEDIFQSALREAEMRAERAEKLLDSMQGGRDELKEKELDERVSDLTKQLEKEKKKANKKIDKLTNELEEEKIRASDREKILEKRVNDLTNELEKEKLQSTKRTISLANQLEGGTTRKAAANKRIDMLAAAAAGTEPVIYTSADSFNILRLFTSGSLVAITINDAQKQLRAALKKCSPFAWRKLKKTKAKYDCEVCGIKMTRRMDIIDHFLTEEHAEKVRAHGAAVSRTAVMSWLNTMEQSASAN